MNEVSDMLQRMNELTVKAANGTYTTTQKQYIADEINQLISEIDRIASTTKFNDVKVLNGSTSSITLQVGNEHGETMSIALGATYATNIGLTSKVDWSSATTASAVSTFIDKVKDAMEKVASKRSALGAVQNRLDHTVNNLDNIVENTQAAESRIRDTDMAKSMVVYSNNQVLVQAGQAMLAQANQIKQGVLSLLQ